WWESASVVRDLAPMPTSSTGDASRRDKAVAAALSHHRSAENSARSRIETPSAGTGPGGRTLALLDRCCEPGRLHALVRGRPRCARRWAGSADKRDPLLTATSPFPIDQRIENEMRSASDGATTMSPGMEPNRSGNGRFIPFRVLSLS